MATCKLHSLRAFFEQWKPSVEEKRHLAASGIPWSSDQPKSVRLEQMRVPATHANNGRGLISARSIVRALDGSFIRVRSANLIAGALGNSLEESRCEYRVTAEHQRGDGRESADDISHSLREKLGALADLTIKDFKPLARSLKAVKSSARSFHDGDLDSFEAIIPELRGLVAYLRAVKLSAHLRGQFPNGIKPDLGESFVDYNSAEFAKELRKKPLVELETMVITWDQVRASRDEAHAEVRVGDRGAINQWARCHIRGHIQTHVSEDSPYADGREFDPAMA